MSDNDIVDPRAPTRSGNRDLGGRGRLKEIARAREVVCEFLVGDNEYGSTAESLDRYFLPFAMAARRDR